MSYRMLFVDDDEHLLQGLKRLTRTQNKPWTCDFAASGEEGLELLGNRTYDVIISDMKMPHMDGAAFLEKVREIAPQAVRIVLSGYSKTESIASVANTAHQYLAKPCSFEQLANVIDRALILRQHFANTAIHELAGRLENLPSPSDHYSQLMELLDDPDSTAEAIAKIAKEDVAMVAELLKLTNSQYFSLASTATTVEQAVKLLGTDVIRMLVFNVGIFSAFTTQGSEAKLISMLQSRALHLASTCANGAAALSLPPVRVQLAYVTGMLCEIGILILLDRAPTAYTSLTIRAVQSNTPLLQIEQKALGVNHADLGAYLLGLWGFQDDVVWAVTARSPRAPETVDPGSLTPILQRVLSEYPLEDALKKCMEAPS